MSATKRFDERKFGEWVGREIAEPSGKFGHFRNWFNVQAYRIDRRHGTHSCQRCERWDTGYWIVTRESVATGNRLADVMCEKCARGWLGETVTVGETTGVPTEDRAAFVTDGPLSYERWKRMMREVANGNQQT